MGKKKTGAYMGGGMAKKKGSMYNKGGSMYNKGGMPMVEKAGKKVPAFAADGVGKMNMGGMAKKKKPMASTGYKEGGDVKKKKETFGQAFKRNRNKFKSSGSAADYTFKHNGKSYNILQKGETKAGVMKKFSAPKTSVRPKLRPGSRTAPPISANTKKKIEETVRKVANTDSKDKPSRPRTEKTEQQKRNEINRRNKERQLGIPLARGKGAGTFAGKGAGKDKPKAKPRVAVPDIYLGASGNKPGSRSAPVVLLKDRGKNTKGDAQDNNPNKKAKTPMRSSRKDVIEGQAKFRDRGAPAQLTLSQRNLRKFKSDPSSLTKIQKDRLFKSLKRQGVTIPKGLSGNNR